MAKKKKTKSEKKKPKTKSLMDKTNNTVTVLAQIALVIILFIVSLIIFAYHMATFLEIVAYFTLLAALLFAGFNFYEGHIEKASLVLGGAGIFVFTLVTFLYTTTPLFFFDGTDSCNGNFPIVLECYNYTVFIRDLNIKNYGDNMASVAVMTTVLPKQVNSEGCNPRLYPKLPVETQTTNPKLIISNNLTHISFEQQLRYINPKSPILTSRTLRIRKCECDANFDENKLYCHY